MTNPGNTRFETRVAILAASLLIETGKVEDPRAFNKQNPLTFKEATRILEEYGIEHYTGGKMTD